MIIAAPQVLTPDGIVADVTVVVESGRIAEVGAAERPDVRLPDGILAPGLIDLQVNGCFGIDFADAARFQPSTAGTWRRGGWRRPA